MNRQVPHVDQALHAAPALDVPALAKGAVDLLIRLAAALVAMLTLFLTLLGFGYDYAYLDSFGLSPLVLRHGALDFLMLSGPGLVGLVEVSARVEKALTWEGLIGMYREFSFFIFAMPALLLALFYIGMRVVPLMAMPRLRRPASSWGRLGRHLVEEDRHILFGMPLLGLMVTPALWLICHALLWVLIFLIVMPVVSIPLLSVAEGQRHARDFVIAPKSCRVLGSGGPAKPSVPGARCVRVMQSGKEVHRGRYIAENEGRVWLLRKDPWVVTSVPLDGAVMEDVEDERPPRKIGR